jgi:tetratricopeptide (TPR) repeat protein
MQARCLGFLLLWASSLTVLGCRRHPGETAAFRGGKAAPPSRIAAAPTAGAGPADRGLPSGQTAAKRTAIEQIAAAGGDEDRYRILLRQGDFLTVTAEQHGLDVALLLTDAAGRKILYVDSPIGAWGPETLDFVAGSDGAYLVAVRKTAAGGPALPGSAGRSTGGSAGANTAAGPVPPLPALPAGRRGALRDDGFTLRIAAPRPATAADARRAEGCREVSAGDAAWHHGGRAGSEDALRHYERAARIWQTLGDARAEAVVEIRIGRAWDTLGDTPQAVTHWERALVWFRAGGRREGPPSALFNSLGGGYMNLGRIERARALFAAAMAGARRRGERVEEVVALNNLGRLAQSGGQSWAALALLGQARSGWRELHNLRGEGTTLDNIGVIYTALGRQGEAEDALEASQAALKGAGAGAAEGLAAMNLGWLRFLGGDPAAARARLLQALDLELRAGDRRSEAVVRQRLGMLYRDTGDLPRAIDQFRQVLALLGPNDDPLTAAQTQSHLGEALTTAGDPRAGLRWEESALVLLRQLDAPATEAYALFRRAQAERALDSLEAAREDMESGLARIESIRDQAQARDLRISYLDSVHDQYERLIDILMELNARKPGAGIDRTAVEAAESGRARSLLEIVASARDMRDDVTQEAATARLREVDRRIDAAQAPAIAPRGRTAAGGVPSAGRTGLRDLLAERQKILVQQTAPTGSAAIQPPRILGLDEIQQEILDSDTVLLIYSLGETHSFLFVLGPRHLESFVLPPRSEIAPGVRRLHDLLAGGRAGHNAHQEMLTAKEISEVLLGPAARLLDRPRIAIVADDILAYVPFGALPAPGGDGAPLLATHEVVVLPSASVLGAIRRRAMHRRPARHVLAVLADPLLKSPAPAPGAAPSGAVQIAGIVQAGGNPGQAASNAAGQGQGAANHGAEAREGRRPASGAETAATRAARDLGLQSLPPLPWSRREATSILALAPPGQGLGAVGAKASVELASSGVLADYGLLHFATHAFVDASAPELSGIVLTAPGADGRPAAGFLHSYEIADLHLPAQLVVLSACRSGLGQALRGEGLLGLTQSFFTAGASRVIVSLWDVDDQATALLMERFYRELLGGHRSPAAALRAAQLALRADPSWASPYFWAGFELQGDWRPLR